MNHDRKASYTLLSVGPSADDYGMMAANDSDGSGADDAETEPYDGRRGENEDRSLVAVLDHNHHRAIRSRPNGGGGGADDGLPVAPPTTAANNINIRAAMVHVIGDFVQSVGVLLSAVIIKFYPDAKLVDPVCTFVFSVIVFFTTIKIMRESIGILMDAVPSTINVAKLEKEMRCVDGVQSVHHLTVWSVSVDWNVMAVHLVVGE